MRTILPFQATAVTPIHRQLQTFGSNYKDYEFSGLRWGRLSREHWLAGDDSSI
jgi:hypothetical protein